MLFVTLAVFVFFLRAHLMAISESPSADSGTNLLVTSVMFCIIFILASFISLQVSIDEKYVLLKFGFGIFRKKFVLHDIVSVRTVKNHWYYGFGIRRWLWPKMWLYTISGLDAVEVKMKNGVIYRIGTDDPRKLAQAIRQICDRIS